MDVAGTVKCAAWASGVVDFFFIENAAYEREDKRGQMHERHFLACRRKELLMNKP